MSDSDPLWRLSIGEPGTESYESHEFTRSSWMLKEAREVKKWIGLNPPQMWLAVAEDDPEALTALLCILRRRDGQPDLKFSDVDADYGSMVFVLSDPAAEEEPDPTKADG